MISVLIKTETEKDFGVDFQRVESVVKRFLEKKGFDQLEVSVLLAQPKTIHQLNKKYRGLDEPTTVLTFSQTTEDLEGLKKRQAETKGRFPQVGDDLERLGDIVICPLLADEKGFTIDYLLKHGLNNLLSEISTAKTFRVGSGRGSRDPGSRS